MFGHVAVGNLAELGGEMDEDRPRHVTVVAVGDTILDEPGAADFLAPSSPETPRKTCWEFIADRMSFKPQAWATTGGRL